MEAMKESGQKTVVGVSRLVYIDLLRIAACFSVVLLHVAALNWHTQSPDTFQWQVFNVYHSITRYCVPVLVMISGLFFLDPKKEITYKALFSKYLPRLLAAYIFWSLFYAVNIFIELGEPLTAAGIKLIIQETIGSHYHLWFLPMLMGLYLTSPFFRLITKSGDHKLMKYLLALFFIFGLLVPTIVSLDFPYHFYVQRILNKIPVDLVCGYAGYFILGYYLFNYDVSKKARIAFYICGLLSAAVSVYVNAEYSVIAGEPVGPFNSFLTVTSFFEAAAVFLFFKYQVSKWMWLQRGQKLIYTMSICTFGIYLIHDFIIKLIEKWGMGTMSYNPVLSVPLNALTTFILSFALIYVLRKIPVINKYLI